MSAPRASGQKTYWHLLSAGRIPSPYEVASSKLLYYPERGFEVETPIADWYRRHQVASPLAGADWERFADPAETTYASYTRRQAERETFAEGLLATADGGDYDRALPAPWLRLLERVFAPLRYPCHGLQMIAAYVGQMAPSGRIAIAAMFQTADEMRRVHRLAYRLRQIQLAHPGFGDDARARWERDPLWQPLRRTVEQLLVCYDWGESFAALNLAIKPVLDELWMVQLGRLARAHGDDLLERLFRSLDEDCRWHREWSCALVQTAIGARPENRSVLEGWVARWGAAAREAAEAFRPAFEELAPGGSDFDAALAELAARQRAWLASAGLADAVATGGAGDRP